MQLLNQNYCPISNHKAHDITEKMYQFRFESVPIFYSEKSLFPWQGAVLWSYQEENNPPFPVIQLRKKYLSKENEFLAHELVHAARFVFKEPLFEEILAYQTSKNPFYRFLGPIFLFPQEPLIFLSLFFVSFLLFIYLDFYWLLYLPSFLLSLLFLRLLCLQTFFFLAKKHLTQAGFLSPLAVLLRLSDQKILHCAFCFSKRKQKKIPSLFTSTLADNQPISHNFDHIF